MRILRTPASSESLSSSFRLCRANIGETSPGLGECIRAARVSPIEPLTLDLRADSEGPAPAIGKCGNGN